ncbi:MAG: NTP transferase domain-containing protein [Deltaproteobacteria bacterium]|nr:NTP transferase domain-containing protein [Deltaproteobacteria bacterium]
MGESTDAPMSGANAAVLIIAGGRGTRFWPESRINRPKPLFSIDGKTSLLAATATRMEPFIARERIFVLASADQAPLFRPVLKKLIPPRNLIVEPEGRGTAVAITYGMGMIAERLSDETIVAVMPADHYVTPAAAFQRTLREAVMLAASHAAIVVIGIKPTRPETGYGYLKIGKPIKVTLTRRSKHLSRSVAGVSHGSTTHPHRDENPIPPPDQGEVRWGSSESYIFTTEDMGEGSDRSGGYDRMTNAAFKLDRFVEKPPASAALRMMRSGRYLWNAGMFVMSAAALAAELAQHAPVLAEAMHTLPPMKAAQLEHSYRAFEFDSFDRVVAEKSRNVLGVRARFRWHDVGSWEGLWEALRDGSRNVLMGNVLEIGADGVLARTRDHLMVLLGVKDIVAIETADVILIANRTQSQDVRKVIDELKRRGSERYL